MGLHNATGFKRWLKSAEAKTLHAGRLNIGPRLMLGFAVIILSMLAADAVMLWQFHVVRTQAERLNDVDQRLVAVIRMQTSILAFHDRLQRLADAEDGNRLVKEVGPLRAAVLEDIRRATSALSLPPFEPRRDPTILPTLQVIQSALPSQVEAITTLATSGDWRAVHLRLANQVRPLVSLTSALVEKVEHQASEQQAQTVQNIRRVQRLVFLVVPLTALFTLLISASLGLAITRSITQPLARLVEGSKALARGGFQQQVSVTGKDELAHLGQVFNDTAWRLRDLYATLQSSEDRLRLVIDTIPAYAWSAWPDGSVDLINRRFLEFTGRSIEDMLGWGWGSVVHPDDLTKYVGEWQAAVATGEPMESEARVRRMDGDYRWLLIRNVPLRDERGNIVKWYGTSVDIEDRKQAEEAARRSEKELRDLIETIPTMAFAVGPEGSTEFVSRGWQDYTGLSLEATRGGGWEATLHPDDFDGHVNKWRASLLSGEPFENEVRHRSAKGEYRWFLVRAVPLRDEHGNVLKWYGTLTDIEDRKRAEQERERSRQLEADLAHVNRVSMMGELAASLSHELQQPIAAAITNANACLRWLKRDQPDLEEARDSTMRIVKDGKRAAEIINRLRSFYMKGAPPEREFVDVNEVVREMLVLLRSEASRYSISMRTDLAADLPKVKADRVQLQQVFLNLMLNGIEAMKDTAGELTIMSKLGQDGLLLISVSDTGVGLPAESADQIFKAFFTTKPQGSGMGLAISRSIIEAHGGRLWATANGEYGATFQFTLPIDEGGE